MEKILKVHSVNDYARYIGAEELHPLISVIHYDELEHCRHSLNNYDVYGIFIADVRLDSLTYGLVNYDLHRHALMCVAPGQIGGKTDEGEEIQTQGWALLFDPALLSGTELAHRMSAYTYFSYNTSEALLMSEEERGIYFGDLIWQMTGDSASNYIRCFLMQRAQMLLTSGHTIGETSDLLGFEYPQHFTRMFKKFYGYPPSHLGKR